MTQAKSTEKVVQEIRRKTRRTSYDAGVEGADANEGVGPVPRDALTLFG